MRRVGLLAALGVLVLALAPAGAVAAPVSEQGYIPIAGGVQLEYSLELPAASGRFPVAMTYAGYCEGASWTCNEPDSAPALLAAGYAVLGVSVPGTSCSTGTFDAFTAGEAAAGAAAVEWAAQQPWSDGHIGMFGDSFPGILQLGVAALRPAHLDAVAPWQVTSDLYRDVAYPGGMANLEFGAFWAGLDQPLNSYESGIQQALAAGDTTCAIALAHDLADEPSHNIAIQGLLHPYDDSFWQAREPGADADRIDVPLLGCVTWQDDEVSSRGSSYLSELDPARTWVLASNGYHGQCEENSPAAIQEEVAFFDRFVKGVQNGFESTPHLQLWHETHVNGAGQNVPSWISSYPSYEAMHVQPLSLYFRADGQLALTAPAGGAPADRYDYPGPSLGSEDGIVFGQHNLLWNAEDPAGASVSYTTPPLSRDAEFFGSGSANIWLSSSASNTDLQITLTEVRPDGQEVYVSRGWLQAQDRALDPQRSTALAPYQLDQQADASPLVPGEPTYMRLQLWPFDYVFRKGSSIRLWIDAPTGVTGGWSLNFLTTPAVNSIYADPQHPSALVLGYLPGGTAPASLPKCDTILNQPCRRNDIAVPAGSITIPAAPAAGSGSSGSGVRTGAGAAGRAGAGRRGKKSQLPAVLAIGGGNGQVRVKLRCAAGARCAGYKLTVTPSGRRGRRPIREVIAQRSGTIGSGRTVMVTVRLNHAGSALLRRLGLLRARVTVLAAGRNLRAASVVITRRR
jgi:putative CocE/NonD family hydrolase